MRIEREDKPQGGHTAKHGAAAEQHAVVQRCLQASGIAQQALRIHDQNRPLKGATNLDIVVWVLVEYVVDASFDKKRQKRMGRNRKQSVMLTCKNKHQLRVYILELLNQGCLWFA